MNPHGRLNKLHPLPPLFSLLAASPALLAVDTDTSTAPESFTLKIVKDEAVIENGEIVQYGLAGFTLIAADRQLLGNAIRYNVDRKQLFASGSIVLTMPGLRIEAARIGADELLRTAEVWDVVISIPTRQGSRLTIKAAKAHINEERVLITDLQADPGHGAISALRGKSMELGLRSKADRAANKHRRGAARTMTHISITHPRLHLAGIPVFWSPILYRDFTIDYPWTRYEFGRSSRQGWWIQGWTRVDMPEVAGWNVRVPVRVDWYQDVGIAFGTRPSWRHDTWGSGEILFYGFDEEEVRRTTADAALGTRSAWILDAEHKVSWTGGAAYARYTKLPDADPLEDGSIDPDAAPDERFRSDYLEEDLKHRPFARRGVTATYGWKVGQVVIDTDAPAHENSLELTRQFGAQAVLPDTDLFGTGLHLSAEGWGEQLKDRSRDLSTKRYQYEAGLGFGRWFASGIGLDAQMGIRGRAYHDTRLGDQEEEDADRLVPVLTTGTAVRLEGRFGKSTIHTLTPRLGLEILGTGYGDEAVSYALDSRDAVLDEDLRLGVAELETSIASNGRSLFRANIASFWALREEDSFKDEVSDFGDRLRSVTLDLAGSPIATWELTGRARWDGATRQWATFDLGANWVINPNLIVESTASWDQGLERWQYRPELTVRGGRYQMVTSASYNDDDDLDGTKRWQELKLETLRHMVDGTLSLSYSWTRLDDGGADDDIDRRFGIRFTIAPF